MDLTLVIVLIVVALFVIGGIVLATLMFLDGRKAQGGLILATAAVVGTCAAVVIAGLSGAFG